MNRMMLFTVFAYMLMFFVTCRGCKRISEIIDDIDGLYKSFPKKFTEVKYNNIVRCLFNIKTKTFFRGYYWSIIMLLLSSMIASVVCIGLCFMGNFERAIIYNVYCNYYRFFILFEGLVFVIIQLHYRKTRRRKNR